MNKNNTVVIRDNAGYVIYSSLLGRDAHAKTTQNINEATTFNDPKEIEYVLSNFCFDEPVLVKVKLEPTKDYKTQTEMYMLFLELSKQKDIRKMEKKKDE